MWGGGEASYGGGGMVKVYYCLGCNKQYQLYHFGKYPRRPTKEHKEYFKENIPPDALDVFICGSTHQQVVTAAKQVLFLLQSSTKKYKCII